jgi:hypothetical protein
VTHCDVARTPAVVCANPNAGKCIASRFSELACPLWVEARRQQPMQDLLPNALKIKNSHFKKAQDVY